MRLKDIIDILEAEVLTGDFDDIEIHTACGSDMMSDVLAYVKDQGLLLTGLCNPQVVRTAEMVDIQCVAFVRGKKPDESVIELAKDKGITLISTKYRMYLACGKLYNKGLESGN